MKSVLMVLKDVLNGAEIRRDVDIIHIPYTPARCDRLDLWTFGVNTSISQTSDCLEPRGFEHYSTVASIPTKDVRGRIEMACIIGP